MCLSFLQDPLIIPWEISEYVKKNPYPTMSKWKKDLDLQPDRHQNI